MYVCPLTGFQPCIAHGPSDTPYEIIGFVLRIEVIWLANVYPATNYVVYQDISLISMTDSTYRIPNALQMIQIVVKMVLERALDFVRRSDYP